MKVTVWTVVTGLVLFAWLNIAMGTSANFAANVVVGGAAGDFCSAQDWNVLTSFRLDFDHTTDNKTACLASGTEVGTLATGTIVTPGTPSPGSGGDALYANANTEYIHFDNPAPYFRSLYGELYILFMVPAEPGSTMDFVNIYDSADDRLELAITATGKINALWEDNNAGSIQEESAFDISNACVGSSNCYDDWIQAHVIWDTTAGGNVEFGHQYRVDDNRDGDFEDGGAEDWTSMEYATGDLNEMGTEPTTDDFKFGYHDATYQVDIYIDDVEISYDQP